jgi:hypothetical protein
VNGHRGHGSALAGGEWGSSNRDVRGIGSFRSVVMWWQQRNSRLERDSGPVDRTSYAGQNFFHHSQEVALSSRHSSVAASSALFVLEVENCPMRQVRRSRIPITDKAGIASFPPGRPHQCLTVVGCAQNTYSLNAQDQGTAGQPSVAVAKRLH